MRVNVYAEETGPDQVEIISKKNHEGQVFTGIRFWTYLPVTLPNGEQVRGKFMHHPGDDDSGAVTFWGKRDMIPMLETALQKLKEHYADKDKEFNWPMKK